MSSALIHKMLGRFLSLSTFENRATSSSKNAFENTLAAFTFLFGFPDAASPGVAFVVFEGSDGSTPRMRRSASLQMSAM